MCTGCVYDLMIRWCDYCGLPDPAVNLYCVQEAVKDMSKEETALSHSVDNY